MTSKKDPPKWTQKKPKTSDKPEAEVERQPIEVVTEALVNALGQMRGVPEKDVKKAVTGVRDQVQSLVSSIEVKADEDTPEARKAAAKEVEKLIALFAQTGAAIGGALSAYQAPLAKAMQGADSQKLADGLRLLADYLKNPTPEREAEVKTKMADLKGKFGGMVGQDPTIEEQERKAEIKATVQSSLDEIFRGKKK